MSEPGSTSIPPPHIEHRLTPIHKNSFTPIYHQIQTQLEQLIRSGELGAHDPLPGEAELSRIFGVSRMTCRQALQGLEASGFAYRERGRGTFVRAPKVEKHIAHLLGFSAEMALLGLEPGTEVLSQGTAAATPSVAASLGLAANAPVLTLRRLRLANGEPMCIEHVSLPLTRFPGLDALDFSRRSLYETLREGFDVKIGSADETLEARPASREEARLLRIADGSALLAVARVLLDTAGEPVEAGESLYRGDRYRAVLHVPATMPSGLETAAANPSR